jgi:hypothetical protein
MDWISFSKIPKLLLSATHLVDLNLSDIYHSGYISPEDLATCLSALTRLHTLFLDLLYSQSRRRLPPETRCILPDLKTFWFKGTSEYLDDLVARIDAPRLDRLSITLVPDEMNFDTPHVVQFISRTPRFQEPDEAHLTLYRGADVQLQWASDDSRELRVEISYEDLEADPQPSPIPQVCAMCLSLLPTVENLRVGLFTDEILEFDWNEPIENGQWLEVLCLFTAVKNLYLSKEFQPNMGPALQELVGGRTMEVLPSLQNIFFERSEASVPFQEAIGQFVAARQLSGHPIAVLPL